MKKRLLALLMAVAMVAGLAAGCTKEPQGSNQTNPPVQTNAPTTPTATPEPAQVIPYNEMTRDDNEIYDMILGEFYEYYMEAKASKNLSERRALMAVAEAKMLASGIMLPTTSNGGNYAISRLAPKTVSSVLWGNDSYRFHQAVVTTELIKNTDIDAMRAKWSELAGTGEYEAWAKQYLKDQGYTIKDSYNYVYSSEPSTWDVLATSQQVDSEPVGHTYDGLLEYDIENVQQPALATGYEQGTRTVSKWTYDEESGEMVVDADGNPVMEEVTLPTFTFKIREGAVWTDSQGRKVADVTADDWVAAANHMLDAKGGLEWLWENVILGTSEYLNGAIGFDEVGVRAIDKYTLEYTLATEDCVSYFPTMLGYSIFAPMSRDYFLSQGGKFGAEYADVAGTMNYGKDPDHIAYCGPYVVTNYTEKNTIVYKANESYWNKDNINIHTLTWLYNDGSDSTKAYNDAKNGVIDGAGLTAEGIEAAKADNLFDDYHYTSATDATSFMGFLNANRGAYANYNNAAACVSSQTDDDKDRTHAAMLNQNFRLAIVTGLERGTWNAQRRGETLKNTNLINAYVPGDFVTLDEDVTININGTPTTFPANTAYGEIVQAQLDADQVDITVWDPNAGGATPYSGFDGWYHPEFAKECIKKAAEELKAQGMEVSKEKPIQIDFVYPVVSTGFTNQAHFLKQCLEESLDGYVQVNLIGANDADEWQDSGYNPTNSKDMNYDLNTISGWGPDYGDPCSYLDTLLPDGSGYMTVAMGMFSNG